MKGSTQPERSLSPEQAARTMAERKVKGLINERIVLQTFSLLCKNNIFSQEGKKESLEITALFHGTVFEGEFGAENLHGRVP